MPVVDRLRELDDHGPDVDTDHLLARVRDRLRRRRRRQLAFGVAAVVGLVSVGVASLPGADSEVVDTVGPVPGVVDPYLPGVVPDGFTLAWIDLHDQDASPSGAPWADDATAAYQLGYQREGGEVELRVFPGASLVADAVVEAWDDAQVIDRTQGQEVVTSGARGESPFVVAFDGGVALVLPFSEDSRDVLAFEDQLALARSLRPVDGDEWARAMAGADVAPPYGVRSAKALIRGDGWVLEGRRTRPPASVTQEALALSFDPPSTSQDHMGSLITEWSNVHQNIDPQLTTDDSGRTVAWGVAPPGTASVRLRFATATVIAPVVPYASATAYAVDVGDQPLQLRLIEALDKEGAVLVGMVDATQRSCADSGDEQVTVPDVVGMTLWDAVASASRAGLNVVGTGTSIGDPTGDDAVVTAQAPEAGAHVPRGSCIGFRTR